MTPIADMIERMLAQGVATHVIVDAVRTAEIVTTRHDTVTTPSRSKEAERAARRREKLKRDKANAEANDAAQAHSPQRDAVTTRHDAAPTFLSTLSLNLEGSIEKGRKEKSKSTENAHARGQRMAAGAILTDEFRQAAIKLGAAPNDVPDIWVEFVDYWVGIPGQRGCKSDWPATWRNRVRSVLKRGNGNGRARQPSLSERAFALAEKARSAEREAGVSRPDEPFRGH